MSGQETDQDEGRRDPCPQRTDHAVTSEHWGEYLQLFWDVTSEHWGEYLQFLDVTSEHWSIFNCFGMSLVSTGVSSVVLGCH